MNKVNLIELLNSKAKNSILTLFGDDSKESKEYQKKLNDVLKSEDIYEKIYNKLEPEYRKKPSMQIFVKLIEILEEENYLPNNEAQLNMIFFIGYNLELILKGFKRVVEKHKESDPKDILEDDDDDDDDEPSKQELPPFVKGLLEALQASFKPSGINNKSVYDYQIQEEKLLIKDMYESASKTNPMLKTVTNNAEGVINEIISKESFDKINKLRVFYTDSEGKAGEIVPIYDNNLCKSVTINSFF